jgi:hypothetical protein
MRVFLFPSPLERLSMITIPTTTLRNFRAVCRKTFGARAGKDLWVHIQAVGGYVDLMTANYDAALKLSLPLEGDFSGHAKYELLDACQATGADVVTFHALPNGGVRAECEDRGVPWQREGSAPGKKRPEFPQLPAEWSNNPAGFLSAFADASQCTSGDSGRYALACVQLGGEQGRMAATDGHQLLVQDGFRFPWQEAVLVPANKGLIARELPSDVPVQIGQHDKRIVFRVGDWTLWLRAHEGKFPRVTDILRGRQASQSHCEIDPADAACAVDALPRLPALGEPHQPVILELLNGEMRCSARPNDGSPAVALRLDRSLCDGDAVNISSDRRFLARALAMGFTRFGVSGPEATIQAFGANKQYCWMPLTPAELNPNQQVHVISSRDGLPGKSLSKATKHVATPVAAEVNPLSVPTEQVATPQTVAATTAVTPPVPANIPVAAPPVKPIKRKKRVAGHPAAQSPPNDPSPLDLALALRTKFRESLAEVNSLLHAIKRQRRQSKLVASTLQSLRQLQQAS